MNEKTKVRKSFPRNFQYKHAEYPHVSVEAVEGANKDPMTYTPNGYQRYLDMQNGISPEIIAKRENDNPPPASEAFRPKRNSKHATSNRRGTVIEPDPTDKVGRAAFRKDNEDNIEMYRAGIDPDATEENDSKKKEKEYYTPMQLWEIGMAHFQKDMPNLKIVFTGEGSFGGFEFGITENYPKMKGITAPPGTKFIRTLKKFDRSIFKLFAEIPLPQARDFWMDIISGYGTGSRISRFSPNNEYQETNKSISIDGNEAFKMIPPLDWFDQKVLDLDPIKDLLAIFPAAEAESLLFQLGRVALGRHEGLGHEMHLKDFAHAPVYKHRAMVIFNGAPRVGKSTLMEEIILGISKVGYSYAVINPEPNRFGFQNVLSDLVLCDDMTGSSLKTMMNNATLKSVSSGNMITSEKKGIDEKQEYPRSTLFFSTNEVVFPKSIDRGVIDRMHFLTTYTHNQMLAKSKERGENLFTGDYWLKKAKELNVDKEVLALYLVRTGLERFLDAINITQDETGVWVQDTNNMTLGAKLDELKKQYSFKSPIDPKESIANICRKAHVLASKFRKEPIPAQYNESFSGFTLLHTAKSVLRIAILIQETEEKIVKNGRSDLASPIKLRFFKDIKNWLMPTDQTIITEMIWSQFVSIWKTELGFGHNNVFEIGAKKLQFEEIFRSMVKHLTDKNGNLIEQDRPAWEEVFSRSIQDEDCHRDALDTILKEYEDLIDLFDYDIVKDIAEPFTIFTSVINRNNLM